MDCKQNNIWFEELDNYIDSFDEKERALIAILHKAQSIFGYLPEDLQEHIAKKINIPIAKVNGVVSFYNYFTTEPRGKYQISVCTGTACYVRGADNIVKEFKKELKIEIGGMTEDGLFSLDCLRCVGACGLAPVVVIGKDVHGKVMPSDVKKIIAGYKKLEE